MTGSSRHPAFAFLALLIVAVWGVGCADDTPNEQAAESAVPPQEIVPTGTIEQLVAPENVVAFGGANDVNGTLSKLQGFIAGAAPGPATPGVAAKGLQTNFRLTNTDWLDLQQPVRFAIVDPTGNVIPFVFAVAISDRAAMAEALPKDKTEDDHGNAFSYRAGVGKVAYLNVIDDFAVFSMARDIFPTSRPFLVRLLGATVPNQITLVASGKNARASFQPELDLAASRAREALAKAREREGAALPANAPVDKMIDALLRAADDIDTVIVSVDAPKRSAQIAIRMRPATDSSLGATLRTLTGRNNNLFKRLPRETPFAFGASIDPKAAGGFTKDLVQWSLQLSIPGVDIPADYDAAASDYWNATNGELAFAIHEVPTAEGLRLTALAGIRDAPAARTALRKLGGLYGEKALIAHYKKLGRKLTFKQAAYKIGGVEVDTITSELIQGKPSAGGGALFKDIASSHSAITADVQVVAFGGDAKAAMSAWLEGKVPGGFDASVGMRRAEEKAAAEHFALAFVSPMQLAKSTLFKGRSPLRALATLAMPKTGISLSVGAKEGELNVVVDVPVEQAQAIAQYLAAGGGFPR